MKPRDKTACLHTLADALGGQLLAGEDFSGTVAVDEDLVAEISVRVRRRADPALLEVHRTAALEQLAKHPDLVTRCSCDLKRRSRFGGFPRRCSGRVAAVVVFIDAYSGQTRFDFICGRHREGHCVRPSAVLAVVELPERLLAPARAQAARNTAAWRAEEEAAEAARCAVHASRSS